MYALNFDGRVFTFDLTRYYGIFERCDVNLCGYRVIDDFKSVLLHYMINYYDGTVGEIEQLFDFLFRICVIYLKDLALL